jgi:hypothetical protein
MKKLTIKNFHPFNVVIATCMLAILIMLCTSCKTQPKQQSEPIKNLESGLDCGPQSFTLEPIYILDMIYDPAEGQYIIEYYDELYDIDEYDCLHLECKQSDFYEILNYLAKDPTYEWADDYYITEVVTHVEGGENYRYLLRKKP